MYWEGVRMDNLSDVDLLCLRNSLMALTVWLNQQTNLIQNLLPAYQDHHQTAMSND
jgi:hypothetical protein